MLGKTRPVAYMNLRLCVTSGVRGFHHPSHYLSLLINHQPFTAVVSRPIVQCEFHVFHSNAFLDDRHPISRGKYLVQVSTLAPAPDSEQHSSICPSPGQQHLIIFAGRLLENGGDHHFTSFFVAWRHADFRHDVDGCRSRDLVETLIHRYAFPLPCLYRLLILACRVTDRLRP